MWSEPNNINIPPVLTFTLNSLKSVRQSVIQEGKQPRESLEIFKYIMCILLVRPSYPYIYLSTMCSKNDNIFFSVVCMFCDKSRESRKKTHICGKGAVNKVQETFSSWNNNAPIHSKLCNSKEGSIGKKKGKGVLVDTIWREVVESIIIIIFFIVVTIGIIPYHIAFIYVHTQKTLAARVCLSTFFTKILLFCSLQLEYKLDVREREKTMVLHTYLSIYVCLIALLFFLFF